MLIASDTRLTTGYSIYTRNQSKLFKISDKSIVGSAGCWCDTLTLTRLMNARMQVDRNYREIESISLKILDIYKDFEF